MNSVSNVVLLVVSVLSCALMLATCRSIIKLVDPDELPLYAVSLVLGSYAYSVIGIAAMLIYAGLVLIGVV